MNNLDLDNIFQIIKTINCFNYKFIYYNNFKLHNSYIIKKVYSSFFKKKIVIKKKNSGYFLVCKIIDK